MTIKIENIIAIASFIVFPSLINFKYREYFMYRTINSFSVVFLIYVVFWRFTLQEPYAYNWHVVLPRQEGGDILVELFNFILSVVASVVGNYISKWLDGEDE